MDAAVQILREDGEDALTMRRVAHRCGVTPMALYHHVSNKGDLVDLAMDQIVAEILQTDTSNPDWRTAVLDFADAFRRVLLETPGAGARWVRAPLVTPNMARVTERIFYLFGRGGVHGDAAARAVDALVLVLMGTVAYDLSRPEAVRLQLGARISADEAPLMTTNLAAYAARDERARFHSAVRWMLEGLERDG